VVDLSNIKTITDWKIRDADLPSLPPGEEYERVIAPQKFVLLLQIAALNVILVRLYVGAVEVPFELLPTADDRTLTYRPTGLSDNEDLKRRLVDTGAALATPNSIAMAPGLEVRAIVRNQGEWATRFRVAIVVSEEHDRE